MNDALLALGIEGWKPVLTALLLPPVPFLVLVFAGARLSARRRGVAWLLWTVAALGIWLSCTNAAGRALMQWLLAPPPALSAEQVAALKSAPRTAIVVFGGGRKQLAPEYAAASLNNFGLERLRYGVWLARVTALPLAFSGGHAHGSTGGPAEAEVAARIAADEYQRPLRWTETRSRDTNENAWMTLQLLRADGIEHIVLVTHHFHMRRALGAFERAAQRTSVSVRLTAAPMGDDAASEISGADWLPSRGGYMSVNLALHEWLGRLAGA